MYEDPRPIYIIGQQIFPNRPLQPCEWCVHADFTDRTLVSRALVFSYFADRV